MKFGTLIANRWYIVDVECCQNQMLFVEIMHMYAGVYIHNTILVTEIFCYQYLTINNSANK